MDGLPLSLPDLAEQLMREFESVIPLSTVAETVMRLSRGGAEALAVLADRSRQELSSLASALEPTSTVTPAPAD